MKRPNVNSDGQKELDKAEEQFKAFDDNIKEMTLDRMNAAPKADQEPQTKLSQSEIDKSKDIYLKPIRTISSKEKFNEKFRDDYNFAKEYVQFIAEHKEIIGEVIECWTKKFPGVACEEWKVPTGKPVWGPRYLAEQIASCRYHRFKMDQSVSTGGNSNTQFFGSMVSDNIIQRLDAIPVSSRKSIFMGAKSF